MLICDIWHPDFSDKEIGYLEEMREARRRHERWGKEASADGGAASATQPQEGLPGASFAGAVSPSVAGAALEPQPAAAEPSWLEVAWQLSYPVHLIAGTLALCALGLGLSGSLRARWHPRR